MAEPASGLLAIDVDIHDYAKTAADDAPSVPRTYQSEAAFQAQKASYAAKTDHGNNYAALLKAVPALASDAAPVSTVNGTNGVQIPRAKVKLSKKNVQLLTYAVGELYYDREYDRIIVLCEAVQRVCEVDGKTKESLERLVQRSRQRKAFTRSAA